MGREKRKPGERIVFVAAGIALGILILLVLLARGTAGAATALVLAILYISMCRKYSEFRSAGNNKEQRLSLAIHVAAIAVVIVSVLPL